jgi:hypothetical protein
MRVGASVLLVCGHHTHHQLLVAMPGKLPQRPRVQAPGFGFAFDLGLWYRDAKEERFHAPREAESISAGR